MPVSCRFIIATLSIGVLLTCLTTPLQANGITIEVAPGESIQSALQRAEDGDTVQLLPGVHSQNLRIASSVSLIGDPLQPETVILEARMAGPVIMLQGSDAEQEVLIEGMTIRGASGYTPDGILDLTPASVHLSALIIEDCQANGITVAGGGETSITDCSIRANGRIGIDVQDEASLVSGTRNEFHGNGADLGGYAPPTLRVPLAPQTTSRTIQVPQHYASLQAAVDAAPEGGTIRIDAGEYTTGLTLWKDVSIVGQGEAETTLAPARADMLALSILATTRSVALQNLALRVTERKPITTFGLVSLENVAVIGQHTINQDPIFRIEGGQFTAQGCHFEEIGGVAIQTQAGSSLTIAECSFFGNHRDITIEGTSNATIRDSRFANTREGSVQICDSSFLVEECTFEACMHDFEIANSTGLLRGVESSGATHNGIELYLGANVTLEACTLTRSAGYNLWISGDAIADLSLCQLTQGAFGGMAASEFSAFTIIDSDLSQNHGAGLIIAGQARGEVSSSVVQGNGTSPVVSAVGNELVTGGIVVSVSSHLVLRSVDILHNSRDGVYVDPVDPFYDEALSLTHPMPACPVIEMIDCRIEGNTETGVSVFEAGTLTLTHCTISSNGSFGVYLEGLVCGFGGWEQPFEYNCTLSEDIQALLENCTLKDNPLVGLMLEGSARAAISESSISRNGIGILMNLDATLDLTLNEIVDNEEFGVYFYSEQCEGGICLSPPKRDHLTGYGNVIPGPLDERGNGLGAFTSDDIDYLLAPSRSGK